MDEIKDVCMKIDWLFLLNFKEKEEFKNYIISNKDLYNLEEINKNLNEKFYINKYLKEILLNNHLSEMTFLEIHNNLRKNFINKIRNLEEREEENVENILNNLF